MKVTTLLISFGFILSRSHVFEEKTCLQKIKEKISSCYEKVSKTGSNFTDSLQSSFKQIGSGEFLKKLREMKCNCSKFSPSIKHYANCYKKTILSYYNRLKGKLFKASLDKETELMEDDTQVPLEKAGEGEKMDMNIEEFIKQLEMLLNFNALNETQNKPTGMQNGAQEEGNAEETNEKVDEEVETIDEQVEEEMEEEIEYEEREEMKAEL